MSSPFVPKHEINPDKMVENKMNVYGALKNIVYLKLIMSYKYEQFCKGKYHNPK
jgi:hypothetical protein